MNYELHKSTLLFYRGLIGVQGSCRRPGGRWAIADWNLNEKQYEYAHLINESGKSLLFLINDG